MRQGDRTSRGPRDGAVRSADRSPDSAAPPIPTWSFRQKMPKSDLSVVPSPQFKRRRVAPQRRPVVGGRQRNPATLAVAPRYNVRATHNMEHRRTFQPSRQPHNGRPFQTSRETYNGSRRFQVDRQHGGVRDRRWQPVHESSDGGQPGHDHRWRAAVAASRERTFIPHEFKGDENHDILI